MRNARRSRRTTYALIVLFIAALLAGCSGGDSESAGGSPNRAQDTAGGGARPGDVDKPGTANTAPGKAPARANGREAAANRSVIHSATLRVRAANVDGAATRAKQLTLGAGGYVENEQSATEPAASTLILKIPTDRYTTVLDQLCGQLGTKLALKQQAEDVTREVADVKSRVSSAENSLKAVRKLLDRAGSIGDILKLEDELGERQSDLEALQARQKALQHGTQFATVTVTVEPPAKPAAVKPKEKAEPRGFLPGLKSGWNGFTAFITAAAQLLGLLLPFLVTAAVLGLPVLAFRHRLRDTMRERRPSSRREAAAALAGRPDSAREQANPTENPPKGPPPPR